MTLTKDITAKFAVAAVAVAMIFSAFAPAAQAQTTEDLQQMINDLLAQVAGLQSQLGGGESETTGENAGICPYTWTRDLSIGSEGADVMKLQQFLNSNPDLRVAASGAGSIGAETTYYGPATAAAVSKMQVMYRSEVLTPGGLVNPTGYFGPSSRAKANALCVAAPVDGEEEGEEGSEEEEEEGDMTLGGEASLDSFEIDDADETDVEEGQDDVEIAEITVEFNDGDAEISRLDLEFTILGGKAEDAFDTISLWVDGDMVAEVDASDEDDYQNDNVATPSVLRFSGLDIVAMEDEEVTIVVAASIQNNLDGTELGEWSVEAVSMRFFDADGVATTEDSATFVSEAGVANFTVAIEGAGDDLDLGSSTNDPDETTLPLDEDDNTEYTVFVFELDADDSDGDITLENITIDLALGSTTRNLNEVVDDVMLVIDGKTFRAEDFDGTADTEAVLFDIDGEITIDAEDMVEVEVVVEFENMDGASDLQGVTLAASVDTTDIDAEGESGEGVTLGGSDQDGEAHILKSQGLVIEIDADDIDTDETVKSVLGSDRDIGTYVFTFDVTAFGEDFFTDEDADVVNYEVLVDGVAAPAASSTASLNISGADDATTADFEIKKDETVTYVFTVETDSSVEGNTEVRIISVDYSAADDATEELNVTASPEDDWTSGSEILN